MANSATKSIFSFNKTNNKEKYGVTLGFSVNTKSKYQKFAVGVYETNEDEYKRRGQDKPFIVIPQIRKGKILEEHTGNVFRPDFPSIGFPSIEIFPKELKSFDPDLTDGNSLINKDQKHPLGLAVKAKDSNDALKYTPSWIFGTNDKEVHGPNLDGKNINPNLYACMGIVDDGQRECYLLCCVSVLWLHHWDLFTPPDLEYLKYKEAVRWDYEEGGEFGEANGVKTKFKRNGVEYRSIMDIVREEYDGDESILWQL